MGRFREMRENKSQNIMEISVWRWNRHLRWGMVFFLTHPLPFLDLTT